MRFFIEGGAYGTTNKQRFADLEDDTVDANQGLVVHCPCFFHIVYIPIKELGRLRTERLVHMLVILLLKTSYNTWTVPVQAVPNRCVSRPTGVQLLSSLS
jgi:hypothetical protein